MANHHVRSEQRRFRRVVVGMAVVLVIMLVPVIFDAEIRLELGQRFGWVPANAERLFDEGDPVELVVLVNETPNPYSGPSRIYRAVYIAEWIGTAIRLHDLGRGGTLELPISRYDFISRSRDQRALLFVDEQAAGGAEAVLVTMDSGEVRPLPKGETDPGVPGNWDEEASFGNIGCSGLSPDRELVACIVHGGTRLLFGDWELIVHPFGKSDEQMRVYRGLGSDPVAGWAPDGATLYFQNERGLWRSDVRSHNR